MNTLITFITCHRREIADTKSHSASVRAKAVRHLIDLSIVIGGGVATALSLTTYLQRTSILKGLTTNPAVRDTAAAIFPAVLVTQGMCCVVLLMALLTTANG